MIPGRLTATGFIALIHQWRDIWNNQLRDHLFASRLIAGNGIRIQHNTNSTVISAIHHPGGASGASGGSVALGMVKSATVGGGPAVIAEIQINADGTFTETGKTYNVIIPRY